MKKILRFVFGVISAGFAGWSLLAFILGVNFLGMRDFRWDDFLAVLLFGFLFVISIYVNYRLWYLTWGIENRKGEK